MGGMATCDRWPHGKGARDLRCAPPSLISFPFPYSISFFPLHLSSLPTFFSSSSPSFCCFSRTSGAQPPLPCPFRVPLPCPICLTTCNAPITRTHAFLQPLLPFHRLLTRSSPYFCSPFRPLRDFRCLRPPTASAAYRLISCPTPAFHLYTAAPSPPPLRVPFPCSIFLTTCNAPITRTHAFLQPLPPFHRLLTRSSPYFCSSLPPPHCVCG
jgi:hypothetical protein